MSVHNDTEAPHSGVLIPSAVSLLIPINADAFVHSGTASKEVPNTARQEELHVHAQENSAKAQSRYKDAYNVFDQSRMLWAILEELRDRPAKTNELHSETKLHSEILHPRDLPPEQVSWQEGEQENDGFASLETVRLVPGRSVLVVHVQHNLDLATSPMLSSLLRDLLLRFNMDTKATWTNTPYWEAAPRLVVDLRGITKMDGAGVKAMIEGHLAFKQRKKRFFVLLEPGSQPEQVFHTHSLATIITRIESVNDL